jgi:hypothetical protein
MGKLAVAKISTSQAWSVASGFMAAEIVETVRPEQFIDNSIFTELGKEWIP